jgi:hypothetical protein
MQRVYATACVVHRYRLRLNNKYYGLIIKEHEHFPSIVLSVLIRSTKYTTKFINVSVIAIDSLILTFIYFVFIRVNN